MILLGYVAAHPMHGYGIRKAMERRKMDRWADVRYGSIYSGLARLREEGLVEEAGQERLGGRPPRTLYRATAEGRKELSRLLRKHLSEPQLPGRPVDVALAGFLFLDGEELADALAHRLEALESALEDLGRVESEVGSPVQAVDAMLRDLVEHNRQRLTSEIEWTGRVLRRAREGRYEVDPGELERWGIRAGPGASS